MIAYDETYLSGAQKRLGALYDFAVFGLETDLTHVHAAFLASPLSQRFAAGDPAVVAGRSGEELALEILQQGAAGASTCGRMEGETPTADTRAMHGVSTASAWTPRDVATPEYWTGWALAFYQWASGYSFEAIDERIGIADIRSLYAPYHEMDVRQFCDRLDELCNQAHPQTNLQARRIAAGLSQSQLSRASGVPVRTLQQYEQRQKNINRARADYVDALARALACNASDLLERSARSNCEYAFISL